MSLWSTCEIIFIICWTISSKEERVNPNYKTEIFPTCPGILQQHTFHYGWSLLRRTISGNVEVPYFQPLGSKGKKNKYLKIYLCPSVSLNSHDPSFSRSARPSYTFLLSRPPWWSVRFPGCSSPRSYDPPRSWTYSLFFGSQYTCFILCAFPLPPKPL